MAVIFNELGEKIDYSFLTFSDRVDSILDLMHIKKIRFYADLKISRTTSINWKKGTIPLGETFMNIASYLDVDPYWLLTGNLQEEQVRKNAEAQASVIFYRLRSMTTHTQKHKDFYMPLKNSISPVLLVKWQYGIQIPTLHKLKEVAAELDIPFLSLLDGDISPEIKEEKKTDPLRFYHYLTKDKQEAIKTIIMDGYYRQLYEREHQEDPDEILTSKDPYDDPNSGFDAGE